MVRKPRSTQTLDEMSLFDLQVILDRRLTEAQNKLPRLQARRDRIREELEAVEAEIESISGPEPSTPPAPKKRGRKPGRTKKDARSGKVSLPMAIQQVLEDGGRPMNLAEIRESILEKGLVKNPPKSFRAMVSMALSKGDKFKKIDRGVYALKG